MTQLAEERPWLIKIHCANHRVELAVKDAFKQSPFQQIDDLYISIFYLLRNSGKIKSEIKEAANALQIQHYTLPKLTGTRFVGHRRNAYRRLLDIWPAVIVAFENVVTDGKTKSDTKAKTAGLLRKLHSYKNLCLTAAYLDVLELISPCSKLFEGEGLLPGDIPRIITETMQNLQDSVDEIGTEDELLTSHLSRFRVQSGGLESIFPKADDPHRKLANREQVTVPFENMNYLDEASVTHSLNAKSDVISELKVLLERKFADFKSPIFKSMEWFDPKYWTNDKSYGYKEIKDFIEIFRPTITGLNEIQVFKEWKMFKTFVLANYTGVDPRSLWEKVFLYQKSEYQNICKLASIVMCFSGSNSTVERAFSLLTLLLSDRRLRLKHKTLEELLIININDKLWSAQERDEIIRHAADKFLSKRRLTRVSHATISEPPLEKRMRIDDDIITQSEDESTTDALDSDNDSSSDSAGNM